MRYKSCKTPVALVTVVESGKLMAIAAVQPVRALRSRSSVAAVLLFSPQEPLNSANFIIIKRTFFMRRHAIRIFGKMGEEICPDEDA